MPQLPAQQPYPLAPVRFVAFEVQFGLAPSLSTQDGRAAVYERLRDAYPIADAQTTLRVEIGPQGAMPSPAGADLVMTNREHTRSVTIGANALTVQTTVFSSLRGSCCRDHRGIACGRAGWYHDHSSHRAAVRQ